MEDIKLPIQEIYQSSEEILPLSVTKHRNSEKLIDFRPKLSYKDKLSPIKAKELITVESDTVQFPVVTVISPPPECEHSFSDKFQSVKMCHELDQMFKKS
jgi:hypothetical protein